MLTSWIGNDSVVIEVRVLQLHRKGNLRCLFLSKFSENIMKLRTPFMLGMSVLTVGGSVASAAEYSLPSNLNLKKVIVSVDAGNVSITHSKEGSAQPFVRFENAGDAECKLDFELSNDELKVLSVKKWKGILVNKQCRFNVYVNLPEATAFEVETNASEVRIDGVQANGKIDVVASRVHLSNSSGVFRLDTISSKVHVERVTGEMEVDGIATAVNLGPNQGETYVAELGSSFKDRREFKGKSETSVLKMKVDGTAGKVTNN